MGPLGRVVTIDINPKNTEQAKKNIQQHYPDLLKRIEFCTKSVFDGFSEAGPYNAIHVGAAVQSNYILI